MADDRDAEKVTRLAMSFRNGGLWPYQQAAVDFFKNAPPGTITRRISKSVALAAPYGGQQMPKYDDRMRQLRTDHVALVPEGTPGATGYVLDVETFSRSEVPAALDVPRRDVPPYSFRGSPCNLTQLRVLIADACGMWELPRLMMDDAAIYAEDHGAWPARRVKFTRVMDDGVSVVNPEWTEDE